MRILVIGEDAPSCALGERLVADVLPGWSFAGPTIDTGGVTKLVSGLARYQLFARNVGPVLCIADSDRACPLELLSKWMPHGAHPRLVLRLAVKEAESWVLADRHAVAKFFRVPVKAVPPNPDDLDDPKAEVLKLARRSTSRLLRDEMLSSLKANRPGTGYNTHVRNLILSEWRAPIAAEQSASLRRAVGKLSELRREYG